MNLTIKVEHENKNKKESTINYLLSTIYYILIYYILYILESTTERREGWLEEAHIVHMHWRERTNEQIYNTNYKEKN
jgi:hypothetical protein